LNTSKLIVIYSIRFLLVYSKFLLQSNVLLTTFRCIVGTADVLPDHSLDKLPLFSKSYSLTLSECKLGSCGLHNNIQSVVIKPQSMSPVVVP